MSELPYNRLSLYRNVLHQLMPHQGIQLRAIHRACPSHRHFVYIQIYQNSFHLVEIDYSYVYSYYHPRFESNTQDGKKAHIHLTIKTNTNISSLSE